MNRQARHGDDPGSTDSGLLERLRTSDSRAWARFIELYSPIVYVWCRRCELQPADAADVSQDVFQSVSRSIGNYSHSVPRATFRGWLWTITRNAIRNHITRGLKGPSPEGGTRIQQFLLEHPESSEEQTLSSLTVTDDVKRLREALAAIRDEYDDRTFQCFWAMTVDGESAADIAARLQMTTSAVRQAKYRVLRRLRTDLSPDS